MAQAVIGLEHRHHLPVLREPRCAHVSIHSASERPVLRSMFAIWLLICSSTLAMAASCSFAGDRVDTPATRAPPRDSTKRPRYARRVRTEIVVIGGGIIGCAAAAILADRGARVTLVERTAIGAGASGRNLGAIQHPFDPVLAPLYYESLTRYRALAAETRTFVIGEEPAGLLLLNRDPDAAAAQARRQQEAVPELLPRLLSPDEVRAHRAVAAPRTGRRAAGDRLPDPSRLRPRTRGRGWRRSAARGSLIGSAVRPVVEQALR